MSVRKEKPGTKPAYLDPKMPIEKRVRDLLGRMTLDEKIREMGMHGVADFCHNGKFSARKAKAFFKGVGIGALQTPSRMKARPAAEAVDALQRFLVENTRLGIPALIISECLHGFMSKGATIFPQAIGLASTWDPTLIGEMAAIAAREARAVGVHQALAPDLDLARDPRWGRVEETYGEDPFLTSRMGVSYVRGIQGEGPLVDRDHIIATVKHFAAHGSPEAGVNLAPVAVGPRELREVYLVPFKAAVTEAGALSVMPAYSEFDGIPCHANGELLTRILREEWGFDGYVFSDYDGLTMLKSFHHTAATMAEAGRQALEAGLDLEAPRICAFGDRFRAQVKKGEVAVKLIDRAVSRILRIKFLVGLFEHPFIDTRRVNRIFNAPEHRKLARRIAQESIVLLKNRGNILPLDRKVSSLAVIGPNAAVAQLGDYTIAKDDVVSPLEGIRAAVSKRTRVIHAQGCDLIARSRDGFEDAVSAAREAEVAVVVVGGTSMSESGTGWGTSKHKPTCGEGSDRTTLSLPGVQEELVQAVVNTGTPTVVVLINGRPLAVSWIAEHASALLEAWYPGEEGGHALADILFGRVNPSGKLPVSIPRSVGHVPAFYNHKPSARGRYYKEPGTLDKPGYDYVFSSPEPLYEFGYGLSYTKFKYANLRVTPRRIAPGGQVRVSVDVANTGKREGREVVQLYINDMVSSATTPVRVLKGFSKVSLRPGEKKTVEFSLAPDALAILDRNMNQVVEPGDFEVMIGGLRKKFTVR